MILEPRTVVTLAMCMLVWAGFAFVLLIASGKWTHLAYLVIPRQS